MPKVETLRSMSPAIGSCPDAFLDNAGGSQVTAFVADAMHEYMTSNDVQLGADYATSRISTETVDRAHRFAHLLFNGGDDGTTILGPSTPRPPPSAWKFDQCVVASLAEHAVHLATFSRSVARANGTRITGSGFAQRSREHASGRKGRRTTESNPVPKSGHARMQVACRSSAGVRGDADSPEERTRVPMPRTMSEAR